MNRSRKEISDAMTSKTVDTGREKALLDAIAASPAEVPNYLELARVFTAQNRLPDAERILTQALAVTGGGDLMVRELLEDAQLARVRQQVEIANRRD